MNKIAALIAAASGAAIFAAYRARKSTPTVSVAVSQVETATVSASPIPAIADFFEGFQLPMIAPEFESVQTPAPEELKPVPQKGFGTQYDALIISSANNAGIQPVTLYRLLNQESRFRPDIITGAVRSSTGAMGIAQFMPATAREWLGSESAALDPSKAIPGAAKYLAWLVRKTGSTVNAVAAYNWGIGNVQKKGIAKAPAETRQYVQAILPGETIG